MNKDERNSGCCFLKGAGPGFRREGLRIETGDPGPVTTFIRCQRTTGQVTIFRAPNANFPTRNGRSHPKPHVAVGGGGRLK